MLWDHDEEFDYNKSITVFWNLDENEKEAIITLVEWNDDTGHRHYTGDELWELDIELAEDIMSYIDYEFLNSEDFWMSKTGYNF